MNTTAILLRRSPEFNSSANPFPPIKLEGLPALASKTLTLPGQYSNVGRCVCMGGGGVCIGPPPGWVGG